MWGFHQMSQFSCILRVDGRLAAIELSGKKNRGFLQEKFKTGQAVITSAAGYSAESQGTWVL